jgi:hypothetical protein
MAGKDSRGQVTLIRHPATVTAGKKTADKNRISNFEQGIIVIVRNMFRLTFLLNPPDPLC